MKYAAIGFGSLLCLLFVSLTHKLHARSNHIHYNILQLSLEPTDSITTTSNFNHIKVIDLRKNKDTIGCDVARSHNYTLLSDSLPEMMVTMASRIIQPAAVKKKQELLMVIKDLFNISEDYDGSIHFRVDFYLGDGSQYQLVERIDSIYEYRARSYVREESLIYINEVVTYAIIDCSTKAALTNEPMVDSATIVNEEENIKRHQPVYSEAPKDGVYLSYTDFIANKPSDTAFIYEPYYYYDVPSYRFYLSDNNHKKGKSLADTTCFAVCYKGKWYKNFGGEDFKQMKMQGGDFVFLLVLPRLRYVGRLKTPTVSASADNNISGAFRHRKPRKPKYDPQIYKMRIDAITGKSHKIESLPNYLNANSTTL